ncbi:GNAT family N-acetyltransferase [Flavobacterium sp.]|uniref:GNAT family N-acetyltransferase n=1 Tax=Flavobacterium sp. TaxID=239 RepID=UPI00261B13F7|nr:GNAT family N-acetyltransferase [Flavobacterium sp.]
MNIKLETERLILREVLSTDVDKFFELDSNPNVHKYVGNKPVKDKKEVEKIIQNLQQQYAENGIARWAVIDKTNNELIGWSGIKLIREPMNNHHNFYELGYRFIERFWGKGFATETTIALVDYAFENLNTENIYAICDIENIGSKNVLEKTGLKLVEIFDHEGTAHNWFKMTKSDWLHKNQK